MTRRFTLVEAQSLLPQLDRLLREAIDLKVSYDDAEQQIKTANRRVMMMGGTTVDRKAMELRTRREVAVRRLKQVIEEVQGMGCHIKDLDIGLIDFPTLYKGVEVYLCWKVGETGISFWHGVEEGFRGRKSIDRDFLDHHTGEPPQ